MKRGNEDSYFEEALKQAMKMSYLAIFYKYGKSKKILKSATKYNTSSNLKDIEGSTVVIVLVAFLTTAIACFFIWYFKKLGYPEVYGMLIVSLAMLLVSLFAIEIVQNVINTYKSQKKERERAKEEKQRADAFIAAVQFLYDGYDEFWEKYKNARFWPGNEYHPRRRDDAEIFRSYENDNTFISRSYVSEDVEVITDSEITYEELQKNPNTAYLLESEEVEEAEEAAKAPGKKYPKLEQWLNAQGLSTEGKGGREAI